MFAPKILADERDLRLHFFLGQESPAEDRTDPEGVEIVRGRVAAVELDRIALAGQDVTHPRVCGEAGEHRLAVAIMPVARDRHRELLKISLLRFGLENDE